MQFEENTRIKTIGERIGFFFAFLLFGSVFYLILSFLHKIPNYVKYIHVATAVILIYFIGLLIKRFK